MADTITVQYLPGCPHLDLARDRVAEALRRLDGAAPTVTVEEIADEMEAERIGFRGSPTVLVDGVDPFADPGSPPAWTCRVYRHGARSDGAPSVEQLVAAISAR